VSGIQRETEHMTSGATAMSHEIIDRRADDVHAWRVNRLTGLGLSRPAAEAIADRVDWHEVARLVQLGCPASLAVAIVD
jgi:hypothetical protein